MLNYLLWKFRRLLPDADVMMRYRKYGLLIGNMLCYSETVPILQFDKCRAQFLQWQDEYQRRGYKPLEQSDFMAGGGHEINIDHLFMRKD